MKRNAYAARAEEELALYVGSQNARDMTERAWTSGFDPALVLASEAAPRLTAETASDFLGLT